MCILCVNYLLKETVDMISNDPPFVEWHVQFTMVPFKPDRALPANMAKLFTSPSAHKDFAIGT